MEVIKNRRVLIAIDGSKNSDKAFNWYMQFLRKEGDYVIIGQVVEPGIHLETTARTGLGIPPEQYRAMIASAEEQAKARESKYGDILKANGIPFKFHHAVGNPGHEICTLAETDHCHMIIIGTRGMGKIRRTIMGSVSDYVVHHSKIPVCVCRE